MNEVEATQFVGDLHHVAAELDKWQEKTVFYALHIAAQDRWDVDYYEDLDTTYFKRQWMTSLAHCTQTCA